jgi:hypothetical protein
MGSRCRTMRPASSTNTGMRQRRAQEIHRSRACFPSSPLIVNTSNPAIDGLPADAHPPPERIDVLARRQLAHHLSPLLGGKRRIGGLPNQLVPKQPDRPGPLGPHLLLIIADRHRPAAGTFSRGIGPTTNAVEKVRRRPLERRCAASRRNWSVEPIARDCDSTNEKMPASPAPDDEHDPAAPSVAHDSTNVRDETVGRPGAVRADRHRERECDEHCVPVRNHQLDQGAPAHFLASQNPVQNHPAMANARAGCVLIKSSPIELIVG